MQIEPRIKLSTNVEQAPNTPKNGMFDSRSPNEEEIHWFNKSPAKQKSMLFTGIEDLAIHEVTVSFIILLSAFSQLFSPQNSSSKHWSKYWCSGPAFSFGPTIEAVDNILTGCESI